MNRIQIRHLILAALEKLDYDSYEGYVEISKKPSYDEEAQATLNEAVTIVEDLLNMYKLTGRVPVHPKKKNKPLLKKKK